MQITQQEIQQVKQRFGIIGNDHSLINAITRAMQVAPIDLAALIIGESGTGKEFFPKVIHACSHRKHSKYIAVNCGAIPEGTIDSELFGHEKGSFTGAISGRKGYFEEADGGTIFLDEVGELPLTTQARLLRVLETGEFIKVGSSQVQKTNVRIVAATNVNMVRAIAEGHFREDLYYRLSTVSIEIPPLRERGTDLQLLARKFAADFSEKYKMPVIQFTDDAKLLLQEYRWPGNVRQLKNIIEQVSIFEAGRTVDATTLKSYLPQYSSRMLPAVTQSEESGYEHERKLLYATMYKMQKEIDDLQNMVKGMMENKSHHLPEPGNAITSLPSHHITSYPVNIDEYRQCEDAEDVTHSATPIGNDSIPSVTSMTLEDTERETIRQSLMRNGGKRKKTAEELRISERTLYRKIKEYGLE